MCVIPKDLSKIRILEHDLGTPNTNAAECVMVVGPQIDIIDTVGIFMKNILLKSSEDMRR